MMKKLVVAAMSFAFVMTIASTAAAQATATDPASSDAGIAASGSGVLKKAQFRSESAQVNNSSTAFANAITDTVVLTVPGCILAQFHSEIGIFGLAEAPGGRSGQFRILIGGVLAEGHSPFGQVFVSPDGTAAGTIETEGYNAWRCNLAPGFYGVSVQFAPFDAGATMAVRGRTLVTQWKK